MTSRPQKYRLSRTVDAFRVDADNHEAVAKWCGGRVVEDVTVTTSRENPVYPKVVQVPFFNVAGNIDVASARENDYVIKNDNGTHEVWSAQRFKDEGFKPFHHRGGRGGNQSDD